MIRTIGYITAIAAFLIAQAAFAGPAQLNVYSTTAMRGALEELVPPFQKESGQTLALTWGTGAMLAKRIEDGEPADVAILARPNFDTLSKAGKIATGSDVTLAQSSIAVAIKSGARKPTLARQKRLRRLCKRPNRSLTAIPRPARLAVSISPRLWSAWGLPTR
jgi:molybdate transport system substrate-binding protein